MRIGFVTPGYVTEENFSGGIGNYVHRVAKALVSLNHEVHVVTISDIDEAQFEHEGVIVHRVKVKLRRLNQLTRHRLSSTAKWLSFSIGAYRQLKKLHQQHPFDVLQYPNSRACGLVSSFLLPVPHAIRISCYRPAWNELGGNERNFDTKVIEWLEERQIRVSSHVYSPSATLKQILEKEINLSNMKVIRTPIYLETGAWDYSIYNDSLKGKQYLLFFGRYKLLKGFHILAQALPQVFKEHQVQAVLIGRDAPSQLAPSMKEYALSLCRDYSERLVFINQLPHTQLYPIIANARLVVLPSLLDNLPNACMESMALGKPVLGTVGASFDELITDGENGFLVPANDVAALATKINQVWTRPDLEEIGQAAKHKAEELSPERTVQELLQYYQEIISSH